MTIQDYQHELDELLAQLQECDDQEMKEAICCDIHTIENAIEEMKRLEIDDDYIKVRDESFYESIENSTINSQFDMK